MNLKGNRFSLGAGQVVATQNIDGVCHIFMRRTAPISYVRFYPLSRVIESVSATVSYADFCTMIDGNLVEYDRGQLCYAKRI